jgi:DNA-binding CsgD family transcriptional regulator
MWKLEDTGKLKIACEDGGRTMNEVATAQVHSFLEFDTEGGLIFLDASFKPIYANEKALEILFYPDETPQFRPFNENLTAKLQPLIGGEQESSQTPSPKLIMSFRRRYLCRFFRLQPCRPARGGAAFAILMDRFCQNNISRLARRCRLSGRECEALEFLTLGLTSKEIATHMSISPNTVKVLLRTIMIKTGVTTRSGILGKLLETQY